MTVAEKIRLMTDEELAEFIAKISDGDDVCCDFATGKECFALDNCKTCPGFLRWLQSEAE